MRWMRDDPYLVFIVQFVGGDLAVEEAVIVSVSKALQAVYARCTA